MGFKCLFAKFRGDIPALISNQRIPLGYSSLRFEFPEVAHVGAHADGDPDDDR